MLLNLQFSGTIATIRRVEVTLLTLDSYARTSGEKADQLAGFMHWARRNAPKKRMSRADWEALKQSFNTRVVSNNSKKVN